MKCIKAFLLLLVLGAAPTAFANRSLPVSGAIDSAGRKVLTIVNQDPSGVRCNANVQMAAEIANIANTYRVPIQILPASLVPNLPASSVFYGLELVAADAKDPNGQSSIQIVADVLHMEDALKQPKTGLIYQDKVRKEFEALKSTIKTGGK
ncbi:hypothetical protein [Sulfuritalea sp.]|uniref:hypothetical protein n=1 Tax=Sulfuritalea sp. TaxID=2480090 RepID=UPI00286E80C0|nr:hypothetical protein [Sulfuritalea sp.]